MSEHTQHAPRSPAELPRLPARALNAHKGTCGTVCVIGGSVSASVRMIGAPALAAAAALRAGAGLAKLMMPEPILSAGLTICPSATGMVMPQAPDRGIEPHLAAAAIDRAAAGADVLALGPGLGTCPGAIAATLRAIQQEDLPLVLDADGINCLSHIPEFIRDFRAAAVLTPHPGEFSKLCTSMGLKNDLGMQQSREQACQQLAQRLGRVVVLKGAGSVVSDGLRVWTCPIACPALATAGTGDVLTGVLAGLIAQFVPSVQVMTMKSRLAQMPMPSDRPLDLFDAARLGVYIHAWAGELWTITRRASAGMLASDLLEQIPEATQQHRGG